MRQSVIGVLCLLTASACGPVGRPRRYTFSGKGFETFSVVAANVETSGSCARALMPDGVGGSGITVAAVCAEYGAVLVTSEALKERER